MGITMFSKTAIVFAFLALAAVAHAGNVITDCMTCGNDVKDDISACSVQESVEQRVTCAIDCLKTSNQCLHCVCDILAAAFKLDASHCDAYAASHQLPTNLTTFFAFDP